MCAPGTMMDRTMFAPQADELSRDFRVIAYDSRGRTSDRWEGPYDLDDLADDCIALLDRLEIDRCTLAGMSMGGFMALRLALRYPERLDALILLNTISGPYQSRNRAGWELLRGRASVPREWAALLASQVFGKTAQVSQPELVSHWIEKWASQSGDAVYWEVMSWVGREDLNPRLHELSLPVLIVHGDEEEFWSFDVVEEMAGLLSNARLVVVPKAGHTAQLERPEVVNAHLREFLREVYESRPPGSGLRLS
jgi:pimeloyl-ACP methyl ester carboxylesterase